jgi:hypothetical protein
MTLGAGQMVPSVAQTTDDQIRRSMVLWMLKGRHGRRLFCALSGHRQQQVTPLYRCEAVE